MSDVKFVTKTEYTYNRLKNEIITGVYVPGDKLGLDKISKTYGVSVIPVREALARLENEGLVQSASHRGAWVHECDYAQFCDLVQISVTLEMAASKLAAKNARERDKKRLLNIVKKMEEAVDAEDYYAYGILNEEFHFLIYAMGGNLELHDLIRSVHERTSPYSSIAINKGERLAESLDEHKKWTAAIIEKDAETSAAYCRHQRLRSFFTFLEFLEFCLENPSPENDYYLYGFTNAFRNMTEDEIRARISGYRRRMNQIVD